MPRTKLTAAFVNSAACEDGPRIEYWDTVRTGLGLRVSGKGTKSWVYWYRANGQAKRWTFGRFPAIDLAGAREIALDAEAIVHRGGDPALNKQHNKSLQSHTVEALSHEFIERHAKKNRESSWKESQRIFSAYINPAIGRQPITEVTRPEIRSILNKVADRGAKMQANRILSAARKFFNWAVENDYVSAAVTDGIKPPAQERDRDRILSEDEIAAVWNGTTLLGWPFGPLFQLLLVTAQRKSEVGSMRWSQIEDDVWSLSRDDTKSDRAHSIHLSDLALDIIHSLPKVEGQDLVFSTNGITSVSGYSKAKARLDKLSGVEDWRIHDLRSTATSEMAALGFPEHVLSRVLNHSTGKSRGVTAIYNRHAYQDEKRHALEAWSLKLREITSDGSGTSNVVRLKG